MAAENAWHEHSDDVLSHSRMTATAQTVRTYHMNKYELLGVCRSASLQEIKSKYQIKVRETHPDKQARHANDNLKAQVGVDVECITTVVLWSNHALPLP